MEQQPRENEEDRAEKTDPTPVPSSENFGDDDFEVGLDQATLRCRLLDLVIALQGTDQDQNYDRFVPICQHFVDNGFFTYPDNQVKVLTALSIAELLRISAPISPFQDSNQLQKILEFFLEQLNGLRDPWDRNFRFYCDLLRNLSTVQTFLICTELENEIGEDILCRLFQLIFSLISDYHSPKVKSLMSDLLVKLLLDCIHLPKTILKLVLTHLDKSRCPSSKSPYNLARELLIKSFEDADFCSSVQHYCIMTLTEPFGTSEDLKSFFIALYEVYCVEPGIFTSLRLSLTEKLRSSDAKERLNATFFLAKVFSSKDFKMEDEHASVWKEFLNRFNDISVPIRIQCVECSMHVLINHPDLREDITAALVLRQSDPIERIRRLVVKAIVAVGKYDISVVNQSEVLWNCLRNSTQDVRYGNRREALEGLGLFYEEKLRVADAPAPLAAAMEWMKDTILHRYHDKSAEEQCLVAELLNSRLVPHDLPVVERVEALLYLYATIDEKSVQAFTQILKDTNLARKHLAGLVSISTHESHPDYDNLFKFHMHHLLKLLPHQVKFHEFICKLCEDAKRDSDLMESLTTILSPVVKTKVREKNIAEALKKTGPPIKTNLYYTTIHALLNRAFCQIGQEEIKNLVVILEDFVAGGPNTKNINNTPKDVVVAKGFGLVSVLSGQFPNLFDDEIQETFTNILNRESLQPRWACCILSTLVNIGKARACPVNKCNSNVKKVLVSQCQNIILTGSPLLGKLAVQCLHSNLAADGRLEVFSSIITDLRENLDNSNVNYRTLIVATGHIALLMPEEFKLEMKAIVSQKLVKQLLMNPPRIDNPQGQNLRSWCNLEELPEITRCMIQGMKAIVRWLLGTKTDIKSAEKTFKLLTAFVKTGGTFLSVKVPFSEAEKAWLRLKAGCCMLKICQQKGVGDQFTPLQFFTLSVLMNDPVKQVKLLFIEKLHKGLSAGFPNKCLPLDFMGFYALAGYETDEEFITRSKEVITEDVKSRRLYINSLRANKLSSDKAVDQIPNLLPDCMLIFAVPVLANNPNFTSHVDKSQLGAVANCLQIILEPLLYTITSCYTFQTLFQKLKNYKNAMNPEDEDVNRRFYSICDVGFFMAKLYYFSPYEVQDFPFNPRIPSMYFKRNDDPNWVNTQVYIPADISFGFEQCATHLHTTNTTLNKKKRKLESQLESDDPGSTSSRSKHPSVHHAMELVPEILISDTAE